MSSFCRPFQTFEPSFFEGLRVSPFVEAQNFQICVFHQFDEAQPKKWYVLHKHYQKLMFKRSFCLFFDTRKGFHPYERRPGISRKRNSPFNSEALPDKGKQQKMD